MGAGIWVGAVSPFLWEPSQCALAWSWQQVPRSAGRSGSDPRNDPVSGQWEAGGRRRRAAGKSGLFIHTRGIPISAGQSVFFHRREMN